MVSFAQSTLPQRTLADHELVASGDTPNTHEITERYHVLLNKYRPLIMKCACALTAPGTADYDDFCQIGSLALMEGLRSYCPERGEMGPYLKKVLTNAVYCAGRKQRGYAEFKARLNNRIDAGRRDGREGDSGVEEAGLATVDRLDALEFMTHRLETWMGSLSHRKRTIVKLVFYSGMTQAEVAACLGFTRARVSQLIAEIVRSGRFHMKDLEELN